MTDCLPFGFGLSHQLPDAQYLNLNHISPVVILLGASLANRKRPTVWESTGVLLSMAGAVILITRGDLGVMRSMGFNAGDLWMLAAVVVWAGYSLLLRRRPADLPQIATLVSSIAVALPMLLPFMLIAASGNLLHLSVPVLLGTRAFSGRKRSRP